MRKTLLAILLLALVGHGHAQEPGQPGAADALLGALAKAGGALVVVVAGLVTVERAWRLRPWASLAAELRAEKEARRAAIEAERAAWTAALEALRREAEERRQGDLARLGEVEARAARHHRLLVEPEQGEALVDRVEALEDADARREADTASALRDLRDAVLSRGGPGAT